jgi:hypothetical protein
MACIPTGFLVALSSRGDAPAACKLPHNANSGPASLCGHALERSKLFAYIEPLSCFVIDNAPNVSAARLYISRTCSTSHSCAALASILRYASFRLSRADAALHLCMLSLAVTSAYAHPEVAPAKANVARHVLLWIFAATAILSTVVPGETILATLAFLVDNFAALAALAYF